MLCKGQKQVMMYYHMLFWSQTQIDKSFFLYKKLEKAYFKDLGETSRWNDASYWYK